MLRDLLFRGKEENEAADSVASGKRWKAGRACVLMLCRSQ